MYAHQIKTTHDINRSARFWNRIAAHYARTPIADEMAYQKKLAVTRQYFRPEMKVLELGCGTGSTAIAHAGYVEHIRAIDYSINMIKIAQAKADANGIQNISFEQAAIENLIVPDRSLDAVLALSVLHLIDCRDEVMSRVYNMLNSGGIFVSSTYCRGEASRYLRLVEPIAKMLRGMAPNIKAITLEQLERSLTNAGFRD